MQQTMIGADPPSDMRAGRERSGALRISRCIKAKARGKRGKRGKRTASTFLRMVSKVGEGSGLTDGADRIRFAIGEVDGAIAPDCDPPRAERDGAQRGAVNEG